MSLLRRALGIPHEERATSSVTMLGRTGRIVPERPESYGQPGMGSWDTGMVWRTGATLEASYVPPDKALRLSAVFGCMRILSQGVATLPLDTFIRFQGTRKPYRPRPEYLNFNPPGVSRIDYISQVVMSLLIDGNAFVATPRDELGVPVALVPLDPTRVEVLRNDKGEIYFKVGGSQTRFDAWDIMHIKITGLVLPGALRGLSPLAAAREVIEGGRKAQEFGNSFLGNHAVPPAVIKVPTGVGTMEEQQERASRIASTWNNTHSGNNAGKVAVLLGGAELQTIAISPEDAQWLDSKRFGVSEIARFFGVPPHLIADASNSTSWGSGLAEQNLAFGQFSLRPLCEGIEEAHGRLMTTHGLPDVFLKLNLDALLRASLTDRYASYAVGITNGFLAVDEVRRLEDLPPIDQQGIEPRTVEMVGSLVRAGFDPVEALAAVGMPAIQHLGLAPVTVQLDKDEKVDVTKNLVEAIQKLYLGVGVVVSAEEAREILNRGGAGLSGPPPTPAEKPSTPPAPGGAS